MNRLALLLLALSPFAVLSGCSLFDTTSRVRVCPAPLPEHWVAAFTTISLTVRVPGQDGAYRAPCWEPVDVELRRREYTPILAFPTIEGREDLLLPAGGLYPEDCTFDPAGAGESLTVDWLGGVAAEVATATMEAGGDLRTIDWDELREDLERYSDGDPWRLSPARIAAHLLSGTSSAGSMSRSQQGTLCIRTSALPTPPATRWISRSPFDPALHGCEDGWLLLSGVGLGPLRLFSEDGSYYLDAWVGSDETAWVVRETQAPPAL